MKATITIEFTVDGIKPSNDTIEDAVFGLLGGVGYVASEAVDGTDEWGLEIVETTISVEGGDDE